MSDHACSLHTARDCRIFAETSSPMQKQLFAATLFFTATFSVLLLASCADKMTDRHSSMAGGNQGATIKVQTETPANTNGMGQPLAGGNVNTAPDTMWNKNSPLEGKPF